MATYDPAGRGVHVHAVGPARAQPRLVGAAGGHAAQHGAVDGEPPEQPRGLHGPAVRALVPQPRDGEGLPTEASATAGEAVGLVDRDVQRPVGCGGEPLADAVGEREARRRRDPGHLHSGPVDAEVPRREHAHVGLGATREPVDRRVDHAPVRAGSVSQVMSGKPPSGVEVRRGASHIRDQVSSPSSSDQATLRRWLVNRGPSYRPSRDVPCRPWARAPRPACRASSADGRFPPREGRPPRAI